MGQQSAHAHQHNHTHTHAPTHIGLQPVLVHLSKNKQGKFNFNPVSVNLLVELAKTVFALVVLLMLVRLCACARGGGGAARALG